MALPPVSELLTEGTKTADILQGYYKEPVSGWKNELQTDDFVIYSRKSDIKDFTGNLYRGEAEFNCSPDIVFKYVEPLPDLPRAQWDKNMKKIEVLKELYQEGNKSLRINRACTDSALGGVISPRDFVDLIYVEKTDEYQSTNAVSVEYENCMATKDHVRGWNYYCGMICFAYPDDPNKCKLVSLIQPDIKGMIPKWAYLSALPKSMEGFFTALRETLKTDGHLAS